MLCLPGITANAYAFTRLAGALSPPRRVLAVDLRGRGGSDKPATGYDVATHVADLTALLDRLAIRTVAVVGWSLGAKVALALGVCRPERVDRLVLFDPPVETPPDAVITLRRLWARLDRTYESVDAFLAMMRVSWTYTPWSPRWRVTSAPTSNVARTAWSVTGSEGPCPSGGSRSSSLHPTRSCYAGVGCPVLIFRAPCPLAGEGDQVLSAE